jgi:hypothetical protein
MFDVLVDALLDYIHDGKRGHMECWGISTIDLETHVEQNKTLTFEHCDVIYMAMHRAVFPKRKLMVLICDPKKCVKHSEAL